LKNPFKITVYRNRKAALRSIKLYTVRTPHEQARQNNTIIKEIGIFSVLFAGCKKPL